MGKNAISDHKVQSWICHGIYSILCWQCNNSPLATRTCSGALTKSTFLNNGRNFSCKNVCELPLSIKMMTRWFCSWPWNFRVRNPSAPPQAAMDTNTNSYSVVDSSGFCDSVSCWSVTKSSQTSSSAWRWAAAMHLWPWFYFSAHFSQRPLARRNRRNTSNLSSADDVLWLSGGWPHLGGPDWNA